MRQIRWKMLQIVAVVLVLLLGFNLSGCAAPSSAAANSSSGSSTGNWNANSNGAHTPGSSAIGGGNWSDPGDNNSQSPSPSNPTDSTNNSTATPNNSLAQSPYIVSIDSAYLGLDYQGKDAIIVQFTLTNNSSLATCFIVSVFPEAYQNGQQLEFSYVNNSPDANFDNLLQDVQPGATVTVGEVFVLTDVISPVSVEVHDYFSVAGSDLRLGNRDFELSSLPDLRGSAGNGGLNQGSGSPAY